MKQATTFRNLTGSYRGRQVLGPLDFELRPGERVALVGRSGAGKSTLLNLVYDRLRAECALLPQDLGLVNALSVFHNVYIGRLQHYSWWRNLWTLIRPSAERTAEVHALLRTLSLEDKIWSPVAELSGGQKQRVGVARALYQGQSLLLADEPVSALDIPLARSTLQALTRQYPSSVTALHDVDLALSFADRIIGLNGGRIHLDRPVAEVTRQQILDLY